MGRHFKWTDDSLAVLKSRYPTEKSLETLANDIGCTIPALYQKAFALKLFRGQRRGTHKFMLKYYTQEQFDFVSKNYRNMSNRTLAVVSGVHIKALKKWAHIHGWRKSERYKEECREFSANKHRNSIRRWKEAHPERVKEWNRRYREKKRNNATKEIQ